jgi:aspartyl-tRNA(Asn)/glutamyl-tRNA(Gln) amidotransferase subunit B
MSDTSNRYVVESNGVKYYPVIGLEIHAELKTQSKMFCSCRNNPDEEKPNFNVCAICMGHPGTLPVLNKEAIRHMVRIGTAIGGKIADFTEWDRKNYFYPDIPKAYQISQYAHPLIEGGKLRNVGGKGADVELTRIHLEEDTASSSHDKGDFSLVNFNRSGVPLMELVTEPVIRDAKTAGDFGRELQLLLRYLGAGEANMEKGEMRVEVNISLSTDPRSHEYIEEALRENKPVAKEAFKTFGIKTEVKNINSFRSAERSIEFEIRRHIEAIEAATAMLVEEGKEPEADPEAFKEALRSKKLIQETRGFDEATGKTVSQRAKENSHDYMYFPDPDIPKLFTSEIPEFQHGAIVAGLPALPWQVRDRFVNQFEMKGEDAEMFVQNSGFRNFFELTADIFSKSDQQKELIKLATNYVTSDLAGLMKKYGTAQDEIKIPVDYFAEMISMIKGGELSSRGAKDLLALMFFAYYDITLPDTEEYKKDSAAPLSRIPHEEIIKRSAHDLAETHGLIQKNDPEALNKMIAELVAANPSVVADYKAGKEAALMFFVGQIMKASKGSVNPAVAKDAIVAYVSTI